MQPRPVHCAVLCGYRHWYDDEEDEQLSEVQSSHNMPIEVKDWLSSTFSRCGHSTLHCTTLHYITPAFTQSRTQAQVY